MAVLLGIDIGTTSTIGILIDTDGHSLATATMLSHLHSRLANWAEEDPNEWWDNARAIIADLCCKANCPAHNITAVGVTGMVPAVVLLDGQGRVLRASMQQNDARAVREIEEMRQSFDDRRFLKLTGGSINQQLVAPKLRWLARHEPHLMREVATVFGSYDYIAYRLTGVRSVEHNWALESGLMDFARRAFTPELVAAAGIEPCALPTIHASHEVVGEVTKKAAAATGLRPGTPVIAGCADHVASAYAAGAVRNRDLVLKFGGAGDILLSTEKPVTDPRLFIDYHIVPGLYFSNGCTATAGSLLNWIVDRFCAGEQAHATAAGCSIHAWLDRKAEAIPAGSDGVVLLPYFLGEKTPLHDPYARGTVVGLGLHHGLAHVWRAALEGIVFSFRHHVEVFEKCGLQVGRVFACDGGAASDLWLQIAADTIARPVQRIARHPGSCLGAAYLAGYGTGSFADFLGIANYVEGGRVFTPDPARTRIYDQAYANFREIYERLRTLYPHLDAAAAPAGEKVKS